MKLIEFVSRRLKTIIKERKITQYQLFKLTGVPQSTISAIIRAESKDIKLSTIYEICSGLGMEFDEFFQRNYFCIENIED